MCYAIKIFIFVIFLLLSITMFDHYNRIKVAINDKIYHLFVSDTPEKRRIGLSRIKNLRKDQGMIFIFKDLCTNKFTMKNTYIPLKIIFLDEDYGIVDQHDCEPNQKDSITSRKPYKYVIEIQQ